MYRRVMLQGFLYCDVCDEVGREPAAVYTPGLLEPGEGLPEDFGRRHAGHAPRRLRVTPESFVTEAAYGPEVPLAFQQVEDAAGARYLVETRRGAAGAPPAYRLHRGALVRTRQAVGSDRDAIARALAGALGRPVDAPVAAAAGRLAGLVTAAAEAVGFEALEATAVAGPTPLVSYAPLPGPSRQAIADATRRILNELAGGGDLAPCAIPRLLEPEARPGDAFTVLLETGYAVVGASGAVEGYLRRVRPRES